MKLSDLNAVASQKVPGLPKYFVQYWVDTGKLPSQVCKDTSVHSDTGSSLSKEGSPRKTYAISNRMLMHKLNDKQQCNNGNNGSSNSSVDTVVYVLSNTNVTKKKNIYSRFFKNDRILKIHKDINCKNNTINAAVDTYDIIDYNNKIDATVDSYDIIDYTISNKKSTLDICSNNETYLKDKEIDKESAIEEIELKLPASCKEDNDEMCENDKQVNEDDANCQNKEILKNSIQKIDNITDTNRNNSIFKDLHNDSARHLRQKKLYVGRESPIDINMYVESEFVNTNINEEKWNLHPAYRSSPLLQKPYRKFMPKKRKFKFFLKNSRNRSQGDTSSNTSASNSVNVERHVKCQKTLDNPESYVDEPQFFSTISQTSGKNKLRQSCIEMEKQIKRFATSKFISENELKKLNNDYVLQNNVKLQENSRLHKYKLRSKTKVKEKVTEEEINVETVSCNTLKKKHNPVVLLERLSEELIKHYINKKDLKCKETRKNNVPIKNMTKYKNKRKYRRRSVLSKSTELHTQSQNVIVDSGNSNASTMIINNHENSQSTNHYSNNDTVVKLNAMQSSYSHNAEYNKLEKLSSDKKLIQMRPVVVLERLRAIKSSKTQILPKLNNMKNTLQPIVVLERLININKNSSYNTNLLTSNEFNKTNVNTIESKETNTGTDYKYENSRKLLYFTTNMNSDSDSESDECTFNLNNYLKYNAGNKMITQNSSNLLKINTPEDFECTEDSKTDFSKICYDSIAHVSTSGEDSFLKKIFGLDKVYNQLHNINRSDNNQQVHALPNVQLTSDTSEKDKGILENNIKNKFVFITKAYDSDSD